MRIALPYNEILPTGKAHDAFLFREAAELSQAECDVHLLVGRGSQPASKLAAHYGTPAPSHISTLPILRKNTFLPLSWNFPFFWSTRHHLQRISPDVVLLSVLKQAADLLAHRQPNIFYIYEAHELACYPHQVPYPRFKLEKWVLERVDLVCVTTQQMKAILQAPPYQLKTKIAVIPLAVHAQPLPPPSSDLHPTVTYVGQLYKEQGIEDLLDAIEYVPDVQLRIIGGTQEEIKKLDRLQPNVNFEGYIPPSQLQEHVVQTHAFVAPFHLTERMPYVAHTKLYEYQAWGRTIIAPESPIVREHLNQENFLLYQDFDGLIEALRQISKKPPLPAPYPAPWSQRIQTLVAHMSETSSCH